MAFAWFPLCLGSLQVLQFPNYKDIHVKLTGEYKLAVGANVNVSFPLGLPCDRLVFHSSLQS